MDLYSLRNQLKSVLDDIDNQIAQDAAPALDFDEFSVHAESAFEFFEGPDPSEAQMQTLYNETGGNASLIYLLASRVQFAESKNHEPMKSPGGYMLAVLRKADRGKLLTEAEQRFPVDLSAPPSLDDDEVVEPEEDSTPPIVKQTIAATKKRLNSKIEI